MSEHDAVFVHGTPVQLTVQNSVVNVVFLCLQLVVIPTS